MRLLTRNTDYALRALLVLGQNPLDYLSAKNISEQQKIPYQYLRKILQRLIKKKIIESKEGAAGGVKIKRRAQDIKLSDIIRIFQGEIQLSECVSRAEVCSFSGTCVLRRRIMAVQKIVIGEFQGTTLKTLLKDLNKETSNEDVLPSVSGNREKYRLHNTGNLRKR